MNKHPAPPTKPLRILQGAARDILLTADTPWIVSPDESETVQRALEDVKRDWYNVLATCRWC